MNERYRVSSFDCDHQPQGSQPEHRTFRSMGEFERHYFPKDVEKYPIVIRGRVVMQEEADAIDEWLRNRRGEQYELESV